MKEYLQNIKNYFAANSAKELVLGIVIILGVIAVVVTIVISVRGGGPEIVYPPVKACDLLTNTKAKELLGDTVIPGTIKNPVLSGDTVTSRCSYTDANPDTENMMVAAIAVRSGINDKGVQKNKTDFAAGKTARNVQAVNDIGDSAYFNPDLGQLNVLNGYDWIIVNYGVGSAPESNTLDKAIELAQKVLAPKSELPTF